MKITLRLEEEAEYRIVEEITREAFWNVYSPGCSEHLIIHKLRMWPQFIKELDYVAVSDDKIVGNIAYVKSQIIDTKKNKKHEIVVLGPVSVLPDYQNKGIGSKLILHTIQRAKELGYKAILLCGDPDYYKKFGFKESKKYNITNAEGKFPVALLILELFPKALNDVEGMYLEDDIYNISEYELEDFDKKFKKKEKKVTQSQNKFRQIINKYL